MYSIDAKALCRHGASVTLSYDTELQHLRMQVEASRIVTPRVMTTTGVAGIVYDEKRVLFAVFIGKGGKMFQHLHLGVLPSLDQLLLNIEAVILCEDLFKVCNL